MLLGYRIGSKSLDTLMGHMEIYISSCAIAEMELYPLQQKNIVKFWLRMYKDYNKLKSLYSIFSCLLHCILFSIMLLLRMRKQ